MNTFQENAENSWPEDEAILEAEHYVVSVLQSHDSMDETLQNKLRKDLKYWQDIFEDDNFLLRFIAEFNKHVPDFCKIPEEMKNEFCKQDDLFS